MLAGIVAILSGRTADIITLSCFGAAALYVLAMIALFVLRRKEPQLERPFRAVAYPVFPVVALVLAVMSLVALTVYNLRIAGIFAGLLALAVVYYLVRVRGKVDTGWASAQ
jgi:ethanolamine permease